MKDNNKIRMPEVESLLKRARKPKPAPHPGAALPSGTVGPLLHVLTGKRLRLFEQVRKTPASIGGLARKMNRPRGGVARDVRTLERFGLVHVAARPLPGHGRQKWVAPRPENFFTTVSPRT